MIRKISLILLILCLVVGLCACNKQEDASQPQEEITSHIIYLEDGRVLYRVNVVDETAQPLQDVLIGFCLGDELVEDVLTGEDGVAEYISEESKYNIRILSVPGGYALMDDPFTFPTDYSEMKLMVPKA